MPRNAYSAIYASPGRPRRLPLSDECAMIDQPFLSYNALLATTENAVLKLLEGGGGEEQAIRQHLATGVVTLFNQIGILNAPDAVTRQRFDEDGARLDGLVHARRARP